MAKNLNPEKRALALFYRDQTLNMTYRQIAQKCKISKSAVYNLCQPTDEERIMSQQQISGIREIGRPKRLNKRMARLLLWTLGKLQKRNINFSVKDLIKANGINPHIAHRRTISRTIWMVYPLCISTIL